MPSLGFMQSMGGLLEDSNNVDCVFVLRLPFAQCRLVFPQRRLYGYLVN